MKTWLAVILVGCSAKQAVVSVDAPLDAVVAIDSPAAPTPLTIPIAMVQTPAMNFVGTVQISVGGSPPMTAFLDTGSVGLRIVTGSVPDADWNVSTQATSITYSGGVVASGVVATGLVKIGDYATAVPIAMQDITAVSCTAAAPNCPAKNVNAADYRFVGSAQAILGIGMKANATTNIASPLASLGHTMEYVLAMPVNGGTAGTITIDPDPTTVARFTSRVQLVAKTVTPGGITNWDDSEVPFCLNQLCSNALLDTGVPFYAIQAAAGDYAKLGVPDNATTIPTGTAVDVSLNNTQVYSFTVGATPMLGVDLVKINAANGPQTPNLGLNPFYKLDVFYDYSVGVIGIAPKL